MKRIFAVPTNALKVEGLFSQAWFQGFGALTISAIFSRLLYKNSLKATE
jgi:hypothetical protein